MGKFVQAFICLCVQTAYAHQYQHRPSHSFRGYHHPSGSGAVLPSSAGAAPYGLGNTTAAATSTGAVLTTPSTTVTTAAASLTDVADSGSGSSPLGSVAAASITEDECTPETVTITLWPSTWVTRISSENPGSLTSSSVADSAATEAIPSSISPSSSQSPATGLTVSSEAAAHSSPAPNTTPATEPTTSSQPAAQSPSAAPAPSNGKSKRGIVCSPELVVPFSSYPKISWDMNWWEGPPPSQPTDWMFLPMLTHLQPDQYFKQNLDSANTKASPYVAGFLEPDINNLAISDAVQSWKANLEPYADKFTLIPPVIGQNGLSWLQQFLAACTGCTIKGPIAFNIYVSADDAGVADFSNHLKTMISAFPGRELWVTNFGQLGDSGDNEWLLKKLIPILDASDPVTHYAWVGADTFLDGSNLSELGMLYATM